MEKQNIMAGQFIDSGSIILDGSPIEIPHFEVLREIGSGANGTVYEARDTLLGRKVAVKIWNARGRPRAQAETSKIASLNHPLVVTTHMFGMAGDHPYAVMELVPGSSGREWMKLSPTVDSRVGVWSMYKQALQHLHGRGVLHGDPHLGNLIVYEVGDGKNVARESRSLEQAMKLADTGTSEIWSNADDFAAREARLIRETAERMFKLEDFRVLADGLDGLAYEEMLSSCNAVVTCISTLNGPPDPYAYSMIADAIIRIVLETPVFALNELHRQASESRMTQVHRVVSRLNGALRGRSEQYWWQGEREITDETRQLYLKVREDWRSGKSGR
jgi:serine/threonine protein kinase